MKAKTHERLVILASIAATYAGALSIYWLSGGDMSRNFNLGLTLVVATMLLPLTMCLFSILLESE